MNVSKELSSNIIADLGNVNISVGVLESIAAKAASEIKGVATSKNTLQKESGGFLGLERDRIRTTVKQNLDEVIIDIYITVQFGYKVPEVALNVQDRVKEQMLFMTDIQVSQVNVHIESIEAEKTYNHLGQDGEVSE